jgi:uncharacterized membrane protein
MRGVKGVEDRLQRHATAGDVPSLQGAGRIRDPRPEIMEENWTPGIRLLAAGGGGLLALYGMLRGGITGRVLGVLGAGMAARGLTNKPIARLLGTTPNPDAVDVRKDIMVDAPVEEVYALWSNFENFPRFMEHVKEVRSMGGGRWHWTVTGPAGAPAEWDAVVTEQVPNESVAWRSEPDSAVKTMGSVRFQPGGNGRTRVSVHMAYTPPAGVVGHAVARLLGADPKKAMDEDLVRFKSLVEKGKTTAAGREVRREEVG